MVPQKKGGVQWSVPHPPKGLRRGQGAQDPGPQGHSRGFPSSQAESHLSWVLRTEAGPLLSKVKARSHPSASAPCHTWLWNVDGVLEAGPGPRQEAMFVGGTGAGDRTRWVAPQAHSSSLPTVLPVPVSHTCLLTQPHPLACAWARGLTSCPASSGKGGSSGTPRRRHSADPVEKTHVRVIRPAWSYPWARHRALSGQHTCLHKPSCCGRGGVGEADL